MAATHPPPKRCLIVDTDVGFDDLVALQCLLNSRSNDQNNHHQQILLTSVGGVVDAARGAATLMRLFPQASIAQGRDSPTELPFDPVPSWLESYRSTTLEQFVTLREKDEKGVGRTAEGTNQPNSSQEDALNKVMELAQQCDDNSLDILCIGPLTNLMHWLQHDDNPKGSNSEKTSSSTATKAPSKLLLSKLRHIWVLGGNHPKEAHEFTEPTFNFGLDPHAAQYVLENEPLVRDKLRIIPGPITKRSALDKCLDRIQIQSFLDSQKEGSGFFSALLKYDPWAFGITYDPVSAFAMEHPDQVTWEDCSIRVDMPWGLLKDAPVDANTTKDEAKSSIAIATQIDVLDYLPWLAKYMDGAYHQT